VREIILDGEPPPPPLIEEKPAPPATQAGRTDYPQLLSAVLRDSDWRSPQSIMLGTIECRSPDPLTVARVGRFEVWHREVRLAILSLPEHEQRAVWRYLHADSVFSFDEIGRLREVVPVLGLDSLDAFAVLWQVLAERNWLHSPTKESRGALQKPGAE